jgi:hypothetical protein
MTKPAAPTPVTDEAAWTENGEHTAWQDREVVDASLCRAFELKLAAAESRLAEAEKDAERYRWLRARVSGHYDSLAPEGQDFDIDLPNVMPGQHIMRGPVSEYFDAAIDAAREGEK